MGVSIEMTLGQMFSHYEELERSVSEIQLITGYTLDELKAKFLAGWELTPPHAKPTSMVDMNHITCDKCKHLRVFNVDEIYAYCQKTGYIFESFGTDTRTHYCSFGECMTTR